jgi:hypothetical protein
MRYEKTRGTLYSPPVRFVATFRNYDNPIHTNALFFRVHPKFHGLYSRVLMGREVQEAGADCLVYTSDWHKPLWRHMHLEGDKEVGKGN